MQQQAGAEQPVRSAPPAVFRAEALRRYSQGRDRAVLPRLIGPRTFLFLWALLVLVGAGASATWFVRVPVYAAGQAIVVEGQRTALNGGVAVVAFLPPEYLVDLRREQALYLNMGSANAPVRQSIVWVEPELMSPNAARTRFGLGPSAAAAITQPVAVVLTRLENLPAGFPPDAYVGSAYPVRVEVGTRRVVSLAPVVGPLFGD
jgi:hypothetical protein